MQELQYPFDAEYLMSNKRRIKRRLLSEKDNYIEKKVAILGGSTTTAIKDMLELFLLNYGIKAIFYESGYNRYYEDAIFSSSLLDEFNPDIVYLCTTIRNIIDAPSVTDTKDCVDAWISSIKNKYISMWNAITQKYSCAIIQNNFEMPSYRFMGNYDAVNFHGMTNIIGRLNIWLAEEADKRNNLYLCDINYIAADYGLQKWHDAVVWYMYKYAMGLEAIPTLAFNVANIIKSIYGKNKKGFVLDLDNTLWGGVIGEDGQDGIELGQELPLGQAYVDFQKYLKKHKEIGVVLNIDSKNEMNNALLGLNHPESQLSQDDFVVIKANWESKDTNLINIASTLNILPESLVFVDDNPAERMMVSEQIKDVVAPNIGKVTDYIKILDHNGFFEVVSLSQDDSKRNEMYQKNVDRAKLQTSYENYGEYLRALEMKAIINPFEEVYLARIVQLANKSNQFNLTTKRYTLQEIEQISKSNDEYITLYGKLEDKFGDNGVVALVIGKITDSRCEIQLWLMSCRVLKRDMECAMMDCLVDECMKRNISQIVGVYIPTTKNKMVADFYGERGFTLISKEEDGSTSWLLDLTKGYIYQNKYIVIGEK